MGELMGKRIAVVLVAALALAACGSSSSSGSGGTGGSGGSNDFASLLQQSKTAKYKVTYSRDSGGDITIAQDPPKFALVESGSATYVTADGSAVTCEGSGSSATCTQLPSTSGSSIQQGLSSAFGAIGSALVAATSAGVPGLTNIVSKSGSKIAGRDATCATIDKKSLGIIGSGLPSGASYSVCVDKDTGVLLSSKSNDGSGNVSSITAKSFASPTAADFTPPATPSTIP
jgi:hypothetical protein